MVGIEELGRGAKTLGDIPGKLLFPAGAVDGTAAGRVVAAGGAAAAGASEGVGVGVGDVDEAPVGCDGNWTLGVKEPAALGDIIVVGPAGGN